MGIATIRTSLQTTLATITELKKVYKYEPKEYVQTPCASLFFDGFEQKDHSIANNECNYRFIVRIAVKLQDADQAQTDMDLLMDKVIAKIAGDRGLGTTGDFYNAMVTTGSTIVIQNHQNAQLVAEMVITADGLISRT